MESFSACAHACGSDVAAYWHDNLGAFTGDADTARKDIADLYERQVHPGNLEAFIGMGAHDHEDISAYWDDNLEALAGDADTARKDIADLYESQAHPNNM